MTEAAERHVPQVREFPVAWPVATRWTDNDMFGHLNNSVYYALWDSAINAWLAREIDADPMTDAAIPLVAESGCRYVGELAYPADLVVGIRADRVGGSSVTFALALYAAGAGPEDLVAAVGRWVHVYVDRVTRRPRPIPAVARAVYEAAR
ncbi:MAG TPA: thioesterase family protein [Tetrasphaera sp.]|jgi:acyl-CoA thioester hydrolase|uniref:Thioesterase family protein n=1 Tax=Nostocoides vanveenii TaxID=330835 RepID=A0ABN2KN02_9MICO|nr:thioesterase family protein [Tetrasphaera sp.]HNQ06027.1 thioesterase family protein [Tetrasphaera sp.]